jgi:hypothetical protein
MPLGEEVLVPGAKLLCVRGTHRLLQDIQEARHQPTARNLGFETCQVGRVGLSLQGGPESTPGAAAKSSPLHSGTCPNRAKEAGGATSPALLDVVGEQTAEIAIALFADTAKLVLASTRGLLWQESDPSRAVSSYSENPRITVGPYSAMTGAEIAVLHLSRSRSRKRKPCAGRLKQASKPLEERRIVA